MVVVGIGVVWSFGTLGILGYEITILTALIPPLLIVIGVPNCIFLINKYHNEFREHGNKSKSLVQMIRRVGNITILTNTTTALGFATFILTSSKDLRQFGLVASINIFAVFILSLLLIPIVFSYLNPPKKRHVSHLDRKWLNNLYRKQPTLLQKREQSSMQQQLQLFPLLFLDFFKCVLLVILQTICPKNRRYIKTLSFLKSITNLSCLSKLLLIPIERMVLLNYLLSNASTN